jgi:6-phosphogluconolactonase
MKPVRVFSSPEAMAIEIALQWYEQAGLMERGGSVFSIVLSGGSTAEKIYKQVAEQGNASRIDWHGVHLFWADERCVPPESEESNYGNCRRFLLDHIPIPKENIHRIRGEEDPSIESVRYSQEIQDHMLLRKGQAKLFDWTFLGVGSDGHTASLFSKQDSLKSENFCEKVRHPQSDKIRITLTPFALRKSNRITYHAIGKEKAEIVSELVSEFSRKDSYPAAQVTGEWYLDREAASYLSSDFSDF